MYVYNRIKVFAHNQNRQNIKAIKLNIHVCTLIISWVKIVKLKLNRENITGNE